MSYSWLDTLVSDPGPPPVTDRGVSIHVARSSDGGVSFQHVGTVAPTESATGPGGDAGWTQHEVSSLARPPDGLGTPRVAPRGW